MDENTKRKQIRKYFQPFPNWAIWMTLIGLIVFFSGVNGSGAAAVIGMLLIGIGGFVIYSFTQGTPSDQQIDSWLQEDFKQLSDKAIKKVGIESEELIKDPLTIYGPILWGGINGVPSTDMLFKVGKDKRTRFAIYKITVFLLTDKQILSFETYFNFLKFVTLNDKTEEFFYKDVTGLTTLETSSNFVLPNGQKLVNSQAFVLKVYNDPVIQIVLSSAELEKFVGGSIPTSEAEKNIQALRTVWREKKV